MKPATMLYLSCIDHLRETAREHGYAVAVHGSMARDLDLIAVPWSEDAKPAADLVEAVRATLNRTTGETWHLRHDDPGRKPHGRLVWSMVPGCGGGAFIDFGVMPLSSAPAAPANPDKENP